MARVIEKGVIMHAKEERRGRELDEPGLPLSRDFMTVISKVNDLESF